MDKIITEVKTKKIKKMTKLNNVSLNIKIELKNVEKNYNIGYNEIYYFNVYINGKKIGGTRQYWAKSTKEIKKMIMDTVIGQINI